MMVDGTQQITINTISTQVATTDSMDSWIIFSGPNTRGPITLWSMFPLGFNKAILKSTMVDKLLKYKMNQDSFVELIEIPTDSQMDEQSTFLPKSQN